MIIRSTTGGGSFSVVIDTEDVVGSLRTFRKEFGKIKRQTAIDIGNAEVLPYARAIAPKLVEATLMIGVAKGQAYLSTTSRGWRRQRFGYLNFGGTIGTPLFPTNARAIKFEGFDEWGNKVPMYRAAVKKPRHFKGKHFMEKARDARAEAFAEHMARSFESDLAHRVNAAQDARFIALGG